MARPRQGARASAPVVKNDANAPALTIWAQFFILPKLYGIIVLAAFSRQLSTLCLSPVYGSLLASFELGWKLLIPLIWLAKMALSESQLALTNWFPMLGYTHSAIQAYLVMFSGRLGPVHGPHYTYFLTSLPLSYLSLLHVLNVSSGLFSATSNSKLIAGRLWTKLICRGFLLLVLTGIIYIIEAWHAAIINNILFHEIHRMAAAATIRSGRDLLGIKSLATAASSRCGWQALTTLVYTCLERSRLRSIAVLPLLHFALMNPHVPSSYNTAILNKRLKNEGFSLVARQESSTGYISVLDNLREGYRVMRCDHSLLGGEWTNKPEGHPAKLNEPIYSIFLMLEAVRLVGVPSDGLLTVKDALVIGLGVGTAPSALIAHGIHTTTVEIDPVVHYFATEYFGLSKNHTFILGDAVKVVRDMQKPGSGRKRYNYIIHDVFTGGAEPLELFTQEYLKELRNILRPDGIIAINYAGDLLLPLASSVVNTVDSVFSNCRFFRETPTPTDFAKIASDYTNMVIFCQNSRKSVVFREPTEADFLDSPGRRRHLLPKIEVERHHMPRSVAARSRVIRRGQIEPLLRGSQEQQRNHIGHWRVMRSVLPDTVWENW